MTTEDWNKLHGYDEYGQPVQRFVWEGIGDGPPIQGGRYSRTWLTDRHPPHGAGELVYTIKESDDVWEGEIVAPRAVSDVDTDMTLDKSVPYEDVIRQAYARCMLRM